MFKPIVKMAIAATITGLFVFATSAAPKASASVDTRALPQPSAIGDRLSLRMTGAACSRHAWPNFEQRCQFDFRNPESFDFRNPESKARTVRGIALR